MPLYEYHCDACGQRFEVIQKFSETTETCRLCGKGPVHRQVSAPGFQFKGTGWYITDYAQKGKSGGESASGTSESAEKSDAKKTDSSASESESSTKKSDSSISAAAPAKS